MSVARFVVGAFRADVARAGATAQIGQFVEELSKLSPEFAALWQANDVRAYGEGLKRLHHPTLESWSSSIRRSRSMEGRTSE